MLENKVRTGGNRHPELSRCTVAPARRRTLALLLSLIVSVGGGCGGDQQPDGTYVLRPVDDPYALPYRFVIERKQVNLVGTKIVPVDLDGDGFDELYRLQTGRHITRELSSILFYPDVAEAGVIDQFNIYASPITSDTAYDFDGDGFKEVAVTYPLNDTVWIEFIHPRRGQIYKRAISSGSDRDGNGAWDGLGHFADLYDFNGDGHVEILIATSVGFDLYRRTMTCLDWYNDQILWQFEVAGEICFQNTYVVPRPNLGDTLVLFGVSSKDNAASVEDMDDQHSYVICLNSHGGLLWKRVTGGAFSSPHPILIQFDPNAQPEILMADGGGRSGADTTGSSQVRSGATLVVCDLLGSVLRTIPFEDSSWVLELSRGDEEYKGRRPIFVVLSGQPILKIYDQRLRLIAECSLDAVSKLCAYKDILGLGAPQFLLSAGDQKLWLLSQEFEPLAQLRGVEHPLPVRFYRSRSDSMRAGFVLNTGPEILVLTLAKTPWYTVFSRHPILAFGAAFVPLSAIVGIIGLVMMRFRQKNRIIGDQRDKLERALSDLKEAQEQLIAAEKFQQARDIAGGVAHEMHNALYPAIASLDTLRRRLVARNALDDGKDNTLLDLTESAVSRAIGMTELVREYSRLESETSRDRVDLRSLVGEIAAANRPRIEALNVAWDVTIPEAMVIACRRTHAYSLVNNLASNALDAVADCAKRRITITAHSSGGWVMVGITDTGPGVPEADRKRIFNAFYSTKPQSGTGLGLAIVRRIVELYDGSLTVTTNDAGGATFVVGLPAAVSDHTDKEHKSIGTDR